MAPCNELLEAAFDAVPEGVALVGLEGEVVLWTALKYVDASRVSVTPDCGFSQTARHVAVAKARTMVEGVRLVRRELEG